MDREVLDDTLRQAAKDYRWLLDRGYPENGSTKLVGDRYRLSREDRHTLYRGVTNAERAARRTARIVTPETARTILRDADASIGIDGYNVLLTVTNYLRGVRVFEADDGLVRDIGGVHGGIRDDARFERAITALVDTIATVVSPPPVAPSAPAVSPATPVPRTTTAHVEVGIYFDAPVSHSGDHARRVGTILEKRGVPADVCVVASADQTLQERNPTLLATSDSVIIDKTTSRIYDLARDVIESHFSYRGISFQSVFTE